MLLRQRLPTVIQGNVCFSMLQHFPIVGKQNCTKSLMWTYHRTEGWLGTASMLYGLAEHAMLWWCFGKQ